MSEQHVVGEATFRDNTWHIECATCGWQSTASGPDSLLRLELVGQKHAGQNGERRRSSDTRYDKFIHRTSRFMAGMFVWMLFVGVASIYLLDQNSEQTDRIQTQRRSLLRSNCEAQNKRHDNTIKELGVLVAQAPDLKAAKAAQPGTIALIDALAPTQDCTTYVKRNVK
jgi:hypothetical protein